MKIIREKRIEIERTRIGGFTLVEMIVSLAIFAIVAVVAAGALLKIMDANKKAQSTQSAITNLNFALESMSRELRVGSKYACDLSSYEGKSLAQDSISHHCSSGSVIGFISSESAMDTSLSPLKACSSPAFRLAYVYRFKEGPDGVVHLQRAEQAQGCSSASIDSSVAIDNQIFSDLISTKNVTIEGYHIQVSETTTDEPYPIVAIRIFGFTGTNERSKTYFDIQTAVSSRIKI